MIVKPFITKTFLRRSVKMKGDIMKIAISSMGTDLDTQIDPRFGRCAHFIIVETDDMSFEAFDNENIALGGGAGIFFPLML